MFGMEAEIGYLARLHQGTIMRARFGCTFAMLMMLAACSGKKRSFVDGPIEGLGGSSGDVATTTDPGGGGTGAGAGPEPAATEGIPVDTLSPGTRAVRNGGSVACEADASACPFPDAGPLPPGCIPMGPRDCSSDADNDCDGQPDNTLDDVCGCVAGASEACDEHPGLDGQGQCRAGLRTCLQDEVTLVTAWGECEGAVGPGAEDSCEPGDDADCDGTPNEGCACVDGQEQPCGSNTNTGPCQIGTSTCIDGRFGSCVGAVAPASTDSCSSRNDDSNCNGAPFDGCSCVNGETQPCGVSGTGVCQLGTRTCINGAFGQCVGQVNPGPRDCRSQQDNDCDGRPDNTIDNVCQCIPGQGNGPCSGDPNNSRCNGQGRCVPCQSNLDCSLSVPGGMCLNGVCRPPSLPTGATCTDNSQCSSNSCVTWFRDRDGDGFGTTDDLQRTCGAASGSSLPPNGYTATAGDCCDVGGANGVQARTIFPGQTQFFDVPQAICPNIPSRDYNCSGDIEFLFEDATLRGGGGCAFIGCNGVTVWDIAQTGGTPPACGAAGPIISCSGASGACTAAPAGFTLNFCH